MKRLQEQFPFDIGILVSCFLSYRKLPSGSCFGIPAGIPHAYIKG
jgi:mannose-6-phosphate isomerase class I